MLMTERDRMTTAVKVMTVADRLLAAFERPKVETEPDAPTVLPKIRVVATGKENIQHIYEALMTAAIHCDGKLFYFECACTSDSMAHAMMGCLVEPGVKVSWSVLWPELQKDWLAVGVPEYPVIKDAHLQVKDEFTGQAMKVRHFAAMERGQRLIIGDGGNTIWLKLRDAMSCPTLESWGDELMQVIWGHTQIRGYARDGEHVILKRALTYGIDADLHAFVLDENANELFDSLVSAFVKARKGLK